MERLRILAAAAAMPNFTIAELCAYAGANERTVRSVLRRDGVDLEELPNGREPSRAGRPPKRFRLSDVEKVHDELRKLESELESLPRHDATSDSEQRRIDDVLLAEAAIIEAWDHCCNDRATRIDLSSLVTRPPQPYEYRCSYISYRSQFTQYPRERAIDANHEQIALAQNAQRRLSKVLKSGAHGDEWGQRAVALSALAELAERDGRGEQLLAGDLHIASGALSDLARFLPVEEIRTRFLPGIELAATRNDQLPPVVVVTHEQSTPPQLSSRLTPFRWVELTGRLERAITSLRRVWMQEWAAPLLERHLMTGALVEYSDRLAGSSMTEPSAHYQLMNDVGPVQSWQVPTIFVVPVSHVQSMNTVVSRTQQLGAHALPSDARLGELACTMLNARQGLGMWLTAESSY
jgi:hypothetical protein